MIKRPTWILLILLAVFLVAYVIINNRLKATSIGATPTAQGNDYLITSTYGALQALHIVDQQNHTFQMQRDSSGTWQITLPSQGTADQGLAEAADTQVGALRIIAALDDQLTLADAGLDSPTYTIELTFVSGIRHIIQVGMLTPINNGYYVLFDGASLYVISQAGIDALVNLITTPPYPATETPNPTLEATLTPTLELVSPQPSLELPTSTP
jgi:hypothetical protein